MRREFSKKVKLAAWQRASGHCEEPSCGVKIILGNGPEYDHALEDYLSGEPTLENCVVLCLRCHKAKTKARRPEIDRTRAQFEKRIGLRKSSRPMRDPRFRKRMDGTIEKRPPQVTQEG